MNIFRKKNYYVSWTAIISGAFIGLGLNFLLNLFSLAIGLASFTVSSSGKTEFSLIGFMCFGLSSIISMFITGWVAGKLTPPILLNRLWGIFFGFLAWCLLLMITIILLTNMIQYAAFHANFTSNLIAIKITNDAPMFTETHAHALTNSPLSLNIETGKKIITLNAFLTFILFFIGGVSSCLGGYLGYKKSPTSTLPNDFYEAV
jgi:hypothetical protein